MIANGPQKLKGIRASYEGTTGKVAGLGVSFFFSSRRRHTRFDCDWSSDVCSSDLTAYARCNISMGFMVGRPNLSTQDRADFDKRGTKLKLQEPFEAKEDPKQAPKRDRKSVV